MTNEELAVPLTRSDLANLLDAIRDCPSARREVRRLAFERDALKARVAELEAALRPFAAMVEYADTELRSRADRDECLVNPYASGSPTYGDCRRATELLARE